MGVKTNQTNFTGGVADPLLYGREDQNFYYNAIEAGDNCRIQPQGGIARRGGLGHVKELRKILSAVDLSGATITTPEGGTAANATDDDLATSVTSSGNVGTTNPFVLLHVDFTVATAVDFVDVIDYVLSSGSLADEWFVQYSDDDATWSDFGEAFNWADTLRSRRRSAGEQVSARYWRIARIGATATAATAAIAEVRFWVESSTLSDGRLAGFANSTEETYMMVVSDRNIDILENVTDHGSISITQEGTDLRTSNWTQSIDTMLLFHEDHAPQKIFRQGADDEFDFRGASFANIPKHDYGAGTGGVNEVQMLNDAGTLGSGDDFTISLEGERTVIITGGGSRAASATAIQAALRALDNTSAAGITVADAGSSLGFEVTFSGDDGARPWLEMSVSVNTGNSVWSVSRTTKGEYPGEDIMSEARGWPRCGTFYQRRLWMGGVSGLPNAMLGSVVGITDADGSFDMNIDQDDDARGLLLRADTDQTSAIYQIVPGRNLSTFTEDTEFYIPNEPIDINAVMKLATKRGIKEGLRVFDLDGALVFVQADGSSLREFIFVDTEQSYDANNISVLSSHLLKNPTDMALRKAVNTDETDLLMIINDDGTSVVLSALRKELVTAFTPWFTRDGDKLLSVGVDKQKRIYFIVERSINGAARRFVEKLDNDLLLDGGGALSIVYDEFIAGAGQTEFTYTFDNPSAGADAIGVRVNGARLSSSSYSVDTDTKAVVLDESVAYGDAVRISSMVKEISGLDHLAGEEVQTYIDGSPGSSYTVDSGGVLTLDDYADTSIQYGFFFDVYIRLMDVRFAGQATLAGQKMRVLRLILSLFQTGHLEVRCNGGAWYEVPLLSMDDDVLDKSLDEQLFTGEKDMKGFSGWGEGGTVEIRQTYPAPFNIRAITREVSV